MHACDDRLPDFQTLSMMSALRTVWAIGLPGSRKYVACAKASSNTPPAHASTNVGQYVCCMLEHILCWPCEGKEARGTRNSTTGGVHLHKGKQQKRKSKKRT